MKYKLGSRGSALALAQVELMQERFGRVFPDDELEFVVVKTTGDKKQGTPEASVSDKREWIHELELGVVSGELDLALHSGKDVPCVVHPETVLIPVCERADPRDLFIGRAGDSGEGRVAFENLPEGAQVGTASLRRRAQLLRLRPDLQVLELRGNIQTRLRKLDEGQADGIVLAAAGIERSADLDLDGEVMEQMLPAVNQGILCAQVGKANRALIEKCEKLISAEARACFFAERRVAEVLDGDCHSAIAIFAEVREGRLFLQSEVYSHDGQEVLSAAAESEIEAASSDKNALTREGALALGDRVGQELLELGAKELLERSSQS